MMTLTPADIRRYATSLPVGQDRAEVRLMSLVITGGFLFGLLEPVFYILSVPASTLAHVAALSVPRLIAGLFLAAAAMTLPHFGSLLFFPRLLEKRGPRKWATWGAMLSAVLWAYLGTLAQPLDLNLLPLLYWLNAVGCVIVGGVYGFSLNSQQIRSLLPDEKSATR